MLRQRRVSAVKSEGALMHSADPVAMPAAGTRSEPRSRVRRHLGGRIAIYAKDL